LGRLFSNPYVLGVIAILLSIWFIFHKGEQSANARWEAKYAAETSDRLKRLQSWGEADRKRVAELDAKLKAELAKERALRDRLANMVKSYVTPLADSRCVVPRGFVLHHNASAAGADLPDASRELVDAAAGVSLSAVESTVSDNYAACRETAQRLRDLQQWLKDTKTRWNNSIGTQ
jgi:hypothetical protein